MVFFSCQEGHWWTGVLSDVPRVERAMSLRAGGAVHTGTLVATLAFFNSLCGYARGPRVRPRILYWIRTEILQRWLYESTKVEPASEWVSSCESIVTPPVT